MRRNGYTIEDLKRCAEERGGECLSKRYDTLLKKYKWTCSHGHVWYASGLSVFKQGHWCPECSGHGGRRHEYVVHKIAAEWGGRVLSKEYNGIGLMFQCSHGHEFKLSPSLVARGKWCPTCKKLTKAVSVAWIAAKSADNRGGRVLTPLTEIQHVWDSVECECAEGHRFHVAVSNLRRSWCPACAREKRREVMKRRYEEKRRQAEKKQ